MPLFDYHCNNCGYEGEHLVSKYDEKIRCPECESLLKKDISSVFNISGKSSRTVTKEIALMGAPPWLTTEVITGNFGHVSEDGSLLAEAEGVAMLKGMEKDGTHRATFKGEIRPLKDGKPSLN